jgi:hypothetical protein
MLMSKINNSNPLSTYDNMTVNFPRRASLSHGMLATRPSIDSWIATEPDIEQVSGWNTFTEAVDKSI